MRVGTFLFSEKKHWLQCTPQAFIAVYSVMSRVTVMTIELRVR